jgi:hypothetical protein
LPLPLLDTISYSALAGLAVELEEDPDPPVSTAQPSRMCGTRSNEQL